jgi:hypothetical protein
MLKSDQWCDATYPEILAGRISRGEITKQQAVRWLMNQFMSFEKAMELLEKS